MIFINYRNDDTPIEAKEISDKLIEEFGAENVFVDFKSIGYGRNIPKEIKEALKKCTVMLVLIGNKWISAKYEKDGDFRKGNLRLKDKKDWVRKEIEYALKSTSFITQCLRNMSLLLKSFLSFQTGYEENNIKKKQILILQIYVNLEEKNKPTKPWLKHNVPSISGLKKFRHLYYKSNDNKSCIEDIINSVREYVVVNNLKDQQVKQEHENNIDYLNVTSGGEKKSPYPITTGKKPPFFHEIYRNTIILFSVFFLMALFYLIFLNIGFSVNNKIHIKSNTITVDDTETYTIAVQVDCDFNRVHRPPGTVYMLKLIFNDNPECSQLQKFGDSHMKGDIVLNDEVQKFLIDGKNLFQHKLKLQVGLERNGAEIWSEQVESQIQGRN